MKKFFFSLAAVATIFASCTNNEIQPVTSEVNDGAYSLKALISEATKTSISDEGVMSWVTGDKIAVYDGDFEEFTLKGEATGAEATFTGEIYDPENACVAICPFDIAAEVADEILTVNLPVTYDYDGQSTHAPMLATGFSLTDNKGTLKFKHIGGLFKVTYNGIPVEAKYFCFESENKQIAGELYIEDYTIENPVIEVGDKPEDGNIVTYTLGANHASSMSFYVPVPVGTFDFNISLRDAENNKIAKSSKTKRGFTIARGDYVEIPAVNMPKTFVENFSSNAATNDNYNCGSNLTTDNNRNDFDYTWSSGTGTVFKNGIKLGSGSAAGSTTSSDILKEIADGTVFTVKVYAAVWNMDGGKIVVSYNGKDITAAAANPAITTTTSAYSASDFASPTSFVFKKVDGVNDLTVASSALRILIDKIEVVEGGEYPSEFGVSTKTINAAWDDTQATFDIITDSKVSWTVSAEEGITPSQTTGSGSATITLSFPANELESQLQKTITVSTEYEPVADLKSYTITFKQAGKTPDLVGDGSKEKPYTVADALKLINQLPDGGISDEAYYVAGDICEVKSYYSAGKSINYYIGTEDANVYVYGGRDLGDGNFSSANDLKVGDKLIVYGKFQKYVNKDEVVTPEIVDSYLYSYNGATSILKSIAVSGAKTSFTQGETWSFGGTVTASYRGKDNADVTSSTTFSGYNTANTGEQTVTASYTENGVTKTAEYTITVAKEGAVQISKVTAVSQFTPGTYIILTYDEASFVPNAVSTSAGPSIGTVTKADGVINITREMVWTATAGSAEGTLKFESFTNAGYFLTGSSSNGGVRVKTNPGTAGDWTPVVNNTYGVIATATGSGNRFLATYGSQDWRNYQSVSETNKVANFFKVVGWVDPGVTEYTLTINSATNGSIAASVDGKAVSNGAKIEKGKTVTITATPSSSDYEFDSWNVSGATVGTSSTETFTMNGDVTVGASFKEKQAPGPGGDPVTVTWVAKDASDNPGNGNDWLSGLIDSNISWSATVGGSNSPKYYDNGTGLRVYNGGKFTVSASNGKQITKIVLTFSGTSYTFSTGNTTQVQTYNLNPSVASKSWDVSRTCRLQKVEVTYE